VRPIHRGHAAATQVTDYVVRTQAVAGRQPHQMRILYLNSAWGASTVERLQKDAASPYLGMTHWFRSQSCARVSW
jgi:hypothetical protein